MSAEEWQAGLRRQFGQEQAFTLCNLGEEPIFSEFSISNPASGGQYRVTIRGAHRGDNHCSCPDFATNLLGTCKHIEFTLSQLNRKRGGKTALRRGFHPEYSEIHLHYGEQRSVRWHPGACCPNSLSQHASQLFDFDQDRSLPPHRYEALEAFMQAAHNCGHELRCHDAALAFIAERRDALNRVRILAAAYPEGANSPQLASLLKAIRFHTSFWPIWDDFNKSLCIN